MWSSFTSLTGVRKSLITQQKKEVVGVTNTIKSVLQIISPLYIDIIDNVSCYKNVVTVVVKDPLVLYELQTQKYIIYKKLKELQSDIVDIVFTTRTHH